MQLPEYETLLERCMAALPEGIDKREGSLIHMAMAPVCLRLAEGYAALRAYYDLMFTDTAAGIYLDRLAEQYGIFRRPASAAVREAVFTGPEGEPAFIPAGSRFYIDGLFFKAEKGGSGSCSGRSGMCRGAACLRSEGRKGGNRLRRGAGAGERP